MKFQSMFSRKMEATKLRNLHRKTAGKSRPRNPLSILNVLSGGKIYFCTSKHDASGPVSIGLLDPVFDLAPQQKVQ